MLQGKDLGAAIRSAMTLLAEHRHVARISQAELADALGMTQPSVSELLKLGRLAKGKLPALLGFFSDVVGPDHFGLPYSRFEDQFIKQLRMLPQDAQQALMARLQDAASRINQAATSLLSTGPESSPAQGKRDGTHG